MFHLPTLLRLKSTGAILFLFVLLFTPCPTSYAQSEDTQTPPSDRWALQFQITNNFTLGSFQGTLLSAKKQLSERKAFRIGVDLRSSYRDESVDGSVADVQAEDRNAQHVFLDAQFITYPISGDVIAAYWGAGPRVGFSRQVDDREVAKIIEWTFAGGIGGVLGVEWFVRPRISLTAEYGAELTYERRVRDQDFNEGGTLERTENAIMLAPRSVLFGISVYF